MIHILAYLLTTSAGLRSIGLVILAICFVYVFYLSAAGWFYIILFVLIPWALIAQARNNQLEEEARKKLDNDK